MPYVITQTEHVDIDGVPLNTPAWDLTNINVLWRSPALRGEDRLIPGDPGVVPLPRRATVTLVPLELVVYGEHDANGVRHDNPRAGLWRNVKHLRDEVADPVYLGDGTRTATLWLPDGTSRSGPVHVENFETGEAIGPHALTAVLEISIVEGALA